MKTKIFFNSLLSIIISSFLCVSCIQQSNAAPDGSPIPLFLSETPQPIVTEASTITPSPIFTPLPTLTTGEQDNYVRSLLKDNPRCQLPCWWSISPGKTSWDETEGFLNFLGVTVGQTELESGVNHHWTLFKEELSELNLSFIEEDAPNGIVDTILVGSNFSGRQDQQDFESMWESYSPREVMRIYGVPSRVLLSTTGIIGLGDSGKHGYIVWIFYDQLGFMIRYDGTVADLPTYHFCLELKEGAEDINRIDLMLQNPSNPLPLERDDNILTTDPSRAMSIQDAAGISVEEFYRLFTQDDKPACFDTPHDIWPVR